MRTHNLTKCFNVLLVTLALVLLYVCLKNLRLTDPKHQLNLEQLIGEISKHEQTVQLKHPGEIAWSFVSAGKVPLVEDDLLFTHSDASATIALKNEQELTVQSESLVRIKSADKIEVKDGQIDLKFTENQPVLAVQIGNKNYQLKASKDTVLKIEKKLNSSTFQVTSGTVELSTENKNLKLESGTATQIAGDEIKTTEMATELLFPKDTVIQKSDEKITFKFQSELQVQKIYLQSENERWRLDTGKAMALAPGAYRWGVLYQGEVTAKVLQDFSLIHEVAAPKLVSPVTNATIELSELESVDFFWKTQGTAQFEVLNSKEEVIFSSISNTNTAQKSFENPGEYAWRVKVQEPFKQSEYSNLHRFFVVKINESDDYRTIEIKKPNQLVKISITPDAQVQDAEYIVSESKDFKDIIEQGKLKENQFQFVADKAGFYYWKVINPDGNVHLKKVLIVPTPAPKRAPKVKDIIKKFKIKSSLIERIFNFIFPQAYASDDEIEITWEKIEEVKEYEIEIINNLKEKKVLLKTTTTKPSLLWKVPGKQTFFYRVRYKDFWDRFSPYSDYARIVIEEQAPVMVQESQTTTKNKKSIYEFHYLVSQVDYRQDLSSQHEAKIKGQSFTGHSFTYRRLNIFDSQYHFSLNYQSQYGEVFESQDFYQRQFNLNLNRDFRGFDVGAGVQYLNYAFYKEAQSEVKFSSDQHKIAMLLFLGKTKKVGEKNVIQPFITFHYLNYQQINLGVNYWYRWNNDFSLNFRLVGEQTRFSVGNDDINSVSYQLFSGITL